MFHIVPYPYVIVLRTYLFAMTSRGISQAQKSWIITFCVFLLLIISIPITSCGKPGIRKRSCQGQKFEPGFDQSTTENFQHLPEHHHTAYVQSVLRPRRHLQHESSLFRHWTGMRQREKKGYWRDATVCHNGASCEGTPINHVPPAMDASSDSTKKDAQAYIHFVRNSFCGALCMGRHTKRSGRQHPN